MKKMRFLSLAVAAVLCAGFVSCGDDDDDEPQKPATENTGGASGDGDSGSTGNDGDDNVGSGNGNTPTNPATDEYGIAVSQEVDLGLSVNWAGWNVGASAPEEYGGYYAWGETAEKSDYDYVWYTYKWCNGSGDTMTKYCIDSYYGTVDGKTVLEPQDDVAHVKWGNGWRMPTKDELEELYNCTWTWISYNGVNGYKVTGKELSNGKRNSIFLPAAGYRYGTSLCDAGSYGGFWSSALNSGSSDLAYVLYFGSDYRYVDDDYRFYGQSVRPVKEK